MLPVLFDSVSATPWFQQPRFGIKFSLASLNYKYNKYILVVSNTSEGVNKSLCTLLKCHLFNNELKLC